MNNLERFNRWREKARLYLTEKGFSTSFFDSAPSGNSSKRLDFHNNDLQATIIAWKSGDTDFEAYSIVREEFLVTEKIVEDDIKLEETLDAHLTIILKFWKQKD